MPFPTRPGLKVALTRPPSRKKVAACHPNESAANTRLRTAIEKAAASKFNGHVRAKGSFRGYFSRSKRMAGSGITTGGGTSSSGLAMPCAVRPALAPCQYDSAMPIKMRRALAGCA